ncbi:MAG: hypothetical protein AAF432_14115 [Planctomycetota bacterium]
MPRSISMPGLLCLMALAVGCSDATEPTDTTAVTPPTAVEAAPAAIVHADPVVEPAAAPASLSTVSDDNLADRWAKRMVKAEEGGIYDVLPVIDEFAALDEQTMRSILPQVWVQLSHRMQVQVMRGISMPTHLAPSELPHPMVRDVLRLGLRTPHAATRNFARLYLNMYTFRNAEIVDDTLLNWFDDNADRPFLDVCLEGCESFIDAMDTTDLATMQVMAPQLDLSSRFVFPKVLAIRTKAFESGIRDRLITWLNPLQSEDVLIASCRTVQALELDTPFMRDHVLPLTERGTPMEARVASLTSLTGRRFDWALDHMHELLRESVNNDDEFTDKFLIPLSKAIASYENPGSIPLLIGVIRADNTPLTVRTVMQYGLCPLASEAWEPETQDTAYWMNWWDERRNRYTPEIRRINVPELTVTARRGGNTSVPAADDAVAEPMLPGKGGTRGTSGDAG